MSTSQLNFALTNLSASLAVGDYNLTLVSADAASSPFSGSFSLAGATTAFFDWNTSANQFLDATTIIPAGTVQCGFTVTNPNSKVTINQISWNIYSYDSLGGFLDQATPLLSNQNTTLTSATSYNFNLATSAFAVSSMISAAGGTFYVDLLFGFAVSGAAVQTIGLSFPQTFVTPIQVTFGDSGARGNDYSPAPDEFWSERQSGLEKRNSKKALSTEVTAPVPEYDEEYMRKNAELEKENAALKNQVTALKRDPSVMSKVELRVTKQEVARLSEENATLLQSTDAYQRFVGDGPAEFAAMQQQVATLHEQVAQLSTQIQQITQAANKHITQLEATIQKMQPELQQHHQMMSNPVIQAVMKGDWQTVRKMLLSQAEGAGTSEEFSSALRGLGLAD